MCKEIGFSKDDIIIEEDTIKSIITTYTNDEKGVRNLKRCFESIISKLNVLKLLNGFSNYKEEKENKILCNA